MNKGIHIRPSRDIRTNYAQISSLAKESPVAITVNGKEDTVLLSHKEFNDMQNYISELEEKINLYSHLALANDDIKLNRIEESSDVFDKILKEIENLNI